MEAIDIHNGFQLELNWLVEVLVSVEEMGTPLEIARAKYDLQCKQLHVSQYKNQMCKLQNKWIWNSQLICHHCA